MSEKTKKRGFASMSPERRTEMARKGGKAAWKKGVAHTFERGTQANSAREKGLVTRRKRAKRL